MIEKLKIPSTIVGMAMSIAISVLGLTTTASAQLKDIAKSQQLPTKKT